MKLTFFGAARTTTGSLHLVEACGKRILLDCGLFQGHRKEAFERNRNMPVDPATIDAVILSHAHVDHSGNLPQLVRRGFRGRVYMRKATADLVNVLLRDSCFLQRRDLEYVNKRRREQGKRLFEPLYEEDDVAALMRCVKTQPLYEPHPIFPGVTLTFHNAGHILGSAITQLDCTEGGKTRRLVFSGDLGQPNQPILRHYDYPKGADAIIVESTYADRDHPSADDVEGRLKALVDDCWFARSKLIVPAFSVGRTQQILHYLNRLRAAGRLRPVDVYLDSPLSQKATAIYQDHAGCFNADAFGLYSRGIDPIAFPGLKYVTSPEESKALNDKRGPMMIIAASGMCEGGRVLHHLKWCASDPRNAILIVGFQAENTLGRRIVEARAGDVVKILGEDVTLNARVHTINALSAHADRRGLMDWFDGVKDCAKQVFAVHGEPEKTAAMVDLLRQHGAANAVAPVPGQSFVVA